MLKYICMAMQYFACEIALARYYSCIEEAIAISLRPFGQEVKMIYDLQKADLWKRISAGLFDFIMIVMLCFGMALSVSAIIDYDSYIDGLNSCYERYEKEYNIDLEIIGTEKYDKLSDEEKAIYIAADEAFKKDEEAIYYNQMLINLMFVIVTSSVVISYLIWEFFIPLIFKNGQTLGKKIFGIAVIRYDCVKVSPMLMFARSMLGKCTVETLIPLLSFIMIVMQVGGVFPLILFAGIIIVQITFFVITSERTLVHDVMAQTVVVDLSSQMIFDTPEALLEYKQKVQAEKAMKSEY